MDYRLLGRSGLKVSALSMGTNTFGRKKGDAIGAVDVKEAKRQIDQCIAAGVNLIDTADAYSQGAAEEVVGAALKGRRGAMLIATKARFPTGRGPNDAGLSRHYIIAACERSLKRLGTDYVDLYQAHEWDGQTPIEEIMDAFDALVRAGKVRYIGCSNFAGWHLMKALRAAGERGGQPFVSQQIHYTLQAREAEYELVPIALDQGIGILVWSPLAGGLLSGKFRRGKKDPAGARHTGRQWREPPVYDTERLHDIVEVLVTVAKGHGVSAARVALAWLLRQPGVTSLVMGARSSEQLADNLAATELKLTADDLKRLDEVSRPDLIYPYWHHAMHAPDRLGPADLSLLGKYLQAPPFA